MPEEIAPVIVVRTNGSSPPRSQETGASKRTPLRLERKYQILSGTLMQGATTLPITDARMNGAQITFVAGGWRYTGRVAEGAMTGNIEGGGTWKASRM